MNQLVIIGSVWPEPQSTAAGSRMLQLISMFQEQEYEITFMCSASRSDYSFDLTQISVHPQSILLNDESFDSEIVKINPSIVVFDRFMIEEQYGWRVAEQCPNALRILDTEDLHFLRKAREMAYKQNRPLVFEDYISDTFKREMAAIYRCDLTLIISEFEMELATTTFNINPKILYYLPFLSENVPTKTAVFSERNHFVSIGNFLHEPNWQTVILLKKYWPTIKKQLPNAQLHIYGAYVTEKAKQLHNEKEGFLINGRAEDIATVFQNAKVLLAPIPYGAGLKGKLFEAMRFGLPSVTTSMGAEGMHGNLEWNGAVIENESEFVLQAVQLYSEELLWEKAQKNGFAILENRFQKSLFSTDFKNKIVHCLQNLAAYRKLNFIGQILQHHSLQSTKYMSKWIEAKNK